MRRGALIPVILAIAGGGGALYLYWQSTQRGTGGGGGDTVAVLIAKSSIQRGTLVDATNVSSLFSIERLPAASATKHKWVIESRLKEDLYGRRVTELLTPGSPLTSVALSEVGASPGDERLKPGEEMFTIGVNEVRMLGGFVRPDDMVDVIAIIRPPSREGRARSEEISFRPFRNVRVYAVGQQDSVDPNKTQAKVARTVTLIGPIGSVEAAALVEKFGELRLTRVNSEGFEEELKPTTIKMVLEQITGDASRITEPVPQRAVAQSLLDNADRIFRLMSTPETLAAAGAGPKPNPRDTKSSKETEPEPKFHTVAILDSRSNPLTQFKFSADSAASGPAQVTPGNTPLIPMPGASDAPRSPLP